MPRTEAVLATNNQSSVIYVGLDAWVTSHADATWMQHSDKYKRKVQAFRDSVMEQQESRDVLQWLWN
jgi:hypothetical protein